MTPTLPGGLWHDGTLERAVRLRPVTGRLEERLEELSGSWPTVVSTILAETVEAIGNCPADEALIDDLCLADRQYLLLLIAGLMYGDEFWVTARCDGCDAGFDLELRRSELPVKPAGAGFPFMSAELPEGAITLRLPTGRDQRCIVGMEDGAALRELLRRCTISAGRAPTPLDLAEGLTPESIVQIELALDAVSPDVGMRVSTRCPECQKEHVLEVDPYAEFGTAATALFEEVHALASHYHWSEHDILLLPRGRRQRYLRLIERARGVMQ